MKNACRTYNDNIGLNEGSVAWDHIINNRRTYALDYTV